MLIIGISGQQLLPAEREWIADPRVSGVILFSRNFSGREQVMQLIDSIRAVRSDPFLLCVDQEGGPVQRFRQDFTRLPALARIGEVFDRDPALALALAEEHAWLMASEMRAIGIDLSFAPVADLKRGNRAIGERAFHTDPDVVSQLTLAYVRGMRLAGMAATVKHFPGHGSVLEDTHFDNANDTRSLEQIRSLDMRPFADAFAAGVEAVMLAHVLYSQVDAQPAGYSLRWIRDILRGEMGFTGAVVSDDIGMAAAESVGGVAARIDAHLDAGCDYVLVCAPALVAESLLAIAARDPKPAELARRLTGCVACTWDSLADNPQRLRFIERIVALDRASV